jgi:methylated-DNA-[protein]-cysteine S-methyltransferase
MNNTPVFYDRYESPLGPLYFIFTGKLLSGISFNKPDRMPFREGYAPPGFIKEMDEYFKGSTRGFKQKTVFREGTDFEKDVWKSLNKIPFGETRSYKWVAEKVGRPGASRAVGQALSRNPVPIVVPCHRVIESDGSIGGYSSGVGTKVRLLEMEYYAKQEKKNRGDIKK